MSRVDLFLLSILGCFFCILSGCGDAQTHVSVANYKTLQIATSDCTLTREFSASIKGEDAVEIRPQVSGIIARICVDEGQEVRKGEVLFVIDQVAYQAALQVSLAREKSAQAALENARMTLGSKEELHKQKIVSDYDLALAQNALATAQANLATAQAEVLSARNNLSYTELKSPTNGAIGMIPYRVGALVNPSISPALTLVSNNNSVHAYFSVSERYLQELLDQYGSTTEVLKKMPEVQLKLSNGNIYDHTGKVDAISGNIDASTGAVSLRATFMNPEGKLRNGSNGTVVLPYNIQEGIIIPQEATFELQNKVFVYKVVDGKAKSVEITVLDQNDGTNYVVLSGLAVGDEIVAEGAGLVREGAVIKAVPQPSQAEGK